jgi:hypothetical protein
MIYNYFGARYYNSDISVWLSVDPLADKYPSMSSYMYTAGNPVMLVDPDGRDNIIYLVDLQNKSDNKIDPQKIINKTNETFEKLGLKTRMVLAPEGANFDPNNMDKTDSYAVLGSVDDVKGFIKSNSPEEYDRSFKDWDGSSNNPEKASNVTNQKTKAIGLNADAINSEASNSFKVEPYEFASFLILHGAGHNANLKHCDQSWLPPEFGNPSNASIMLSGNWVYWKGVNNVIKPESNNHYVKVMKNEKYFGDNPAKDNYFINKRLRNVKEKKI